MTQLVPLSAALKPDPTIEQSLSKTADFLRGYQPLVPVTDKDIAHGQYKIDLNNPMPQYNTPGARAFAAVDTNNGNQLFALVCEPGSNQRHDILERMLGLRNPNICSLVSYGPVELSNPAEERFVLFYERPKSPKLSTLLSGTKARIPSAIIIQRIIEPITHAILALQEAGITHGSINVDNIYFEEHAMLGPCAVDPCGYSQPYYYELPERVQAHPAGKGSHHPGADYYALGVLILEILTGKEILTRYSPPVLARALIRQGPFMALTAGRDLPEEFFDFIWGMLGSGTNQRWTYRYLKPWLEGKHYNIIPAPPPNEGAKPYECFGTNGHSRREVAHLMRDHWDQVQENLSHHSLPQWILMVLRQKDLSELVGRLTKTIIETSQRNENQRNEYIMRLILTLDQQGPMQYSKIAFHPDAIDTLFADLYLKQSQEEIQLLVRFIELNLVNVWVDLQHVKEIEIPEEVSSFFTKLDRLRSVIRNSGLGYGLERLLYDLNPHMPCMSPLCKGKHITNLTALLKHLDKIAPNFAGAQDPIDNHIAAYMASKLGITNEIQLYDIQANSNIANNRALVALKLFAVAQHRSGNIELAGLTHWVAQRVLPSMQFLHSNTIRGRTLQMLLDDALEGRTQILNDLLLDGEIVNADQNGYQKAVNNYHRNAERIDHYRRGVSLDRDSAQLGNVIAKIFAYMALLWNIYIVFMEYQ